MSRSADQLSGGRLEISCPSLSSFFKVGKKGSNSIMQAGRDITTGRTERIIFMGVFTHHLFNRRPPFLTPLQVWENEIVYVQFVFNFLSLSKLDGFLF